MSASVDAPALVVPDLLRRRAAEDPAGLAVVVDCGGTLDYGEWERRSNAVARGLSARGVMPGDVVALLFDNARWIDFAVCYQGVHKAGAAVVPLSPRFAGPELTQVLAHCAPAGVVRPDDLAAALPPAGACWPASVGEIEAGQADEAFQAPLHADDLAEVLYTSGTTGMPKGVACSHANLMFHELPPGVAGSGPERLSFLHAFPVGTNAGQEVLRLPLRRSGRTSVTLPAFDATRLCAAVAEHRVTRLQLVPAMAQVLIASGAYRGHDLSSIERVTLSSAPTSPALLPRLAQVFPGAVICNAYALTESGTARTLMVGAETRPGSVGRPVGDSEVRVVDDGDGDVPGGQTGEVWLRRRGAPRRVYYRDPEATAAAFAGDWLRTGDLGHLDADGYLYLDDRKSDLIIAGGANVASIEVENVLTQHPAVVEAAVFAIPHPVLGQDVAAAVVVDAAAGVGMGAPSARELQAFVRERLAEHKTPHRIVFVDDLPRNASGKVLKRELPALVAGSSGAPPNAGSAAPAAEGNRPTTVQQAVLAIWEEALGRDGIDVQDDFFELGGHSLAATQVVARLSNTFSVEVPVTAVFEAPTPAELAVVVEDLRAGR